MSIDLQIRETSLVQLVQSTIQQTLDTTCVTPLGPIFFDHADVTRVVFSPNQIPGVATLDASINVFVVDMPSLLANANETPPGALGPPENGMIQLQIAVQGTVLSITCLSVTLGDPSLSGIAQQLKSAIPPLQMDLAAMFSQLKLPSPTTSRLEEVAGSLAVRFDPSSVAALNHLQDEQEWCLFLDVPTVKQIVANNLSGPLNELTAHGVTGNPPVIDWAPSPTGLVPHVSIKVTGKAKVPDPFTARVEFDLSMDFTLQSVRPANKTLAPKDLQEIASWKLSIDLGPFSPPTIGDFVAALIAGDFDPTKFGGTVIGPSAFSLSQSLPLLAFGPGTLFYSTVDGLADGMTLGGPVTEIPLTNTDIVSYTVSKFPSKFTIVTDCRSGGKVGVATLTNVYVRASALFREAGQLCSVTVLSPIQSSFDVSPYLGLSPASGTLTDSVSISENLSGLSSLAVNNVGGPIRLLVNTARGVRVVDFGSPPVPVLDNNGNVANFETLYFNDCPGTPVPWSQHFHSYNPKWGVDPYELWIENLEQVAIFESSLIDVAGLEPGELIMFDQPADGGRAVYSAGPSGHVIVPAILPVRSFDAGATLSRVNRRPLDRVVQTTMFFERVAVLNTPGALSHQLSVVGGRAVITSSFVDRNEVTEIGSLGIPQKLRSQHSKHQSVASHNAAQSSIHEHHDNRLGIPGVVRMRTIPGFEDELLSLAELDDGTYLVLAFEADKSLRVTGTVPRWPDMPPVWGQWAISSSKGSRVAVFTVRRAMPSA